MSSYEEDTREALKAEFDSGELREVGQSTAVFGQLSMAFPASGSKIDWKRVAGSIERVEDDQSLQTEEFAAFFNEMRSKFLLTGVVIYVGDGATDFAIEGSVDAMKRALSQLLEVSQHHYFISANYSWCMCLTMEGDMAFGLSGNSLSQH